MKYLKYALISIGILLLVFLGNGLLNPSITYGSEVLVDKSVSEAWSVMNDQSKLSQWLQDIKKIEHVKGERGTVGAVTRYIADDGSQETTIYETIKSVSPNEEISMDFEVEGIMKMDYKVVFQEEGSTTRISSNSTVKGEGMFMKAMLSFMKSSMQSQEDENLGNLQRLINSNTTDYFPKPDSVAVE